MSSRIRTENEEKQEAPEIKPPKGYYDQPSVFRPEQRKVEIEPRQRQNPVSNP